MCGVHSVHKSGGTIKNMDIFVDSRNPVIVVMDMMSNGAEFEVVELPKCEKKYYINENGEYVRYDST